MTRLTGDNNDHVDEIGIGIFNCAARPFSAIQFALPLGFDNCWTLFESLKA